MKKLNAIKGATYRVDKHRKDWSFSRTKHFASRDLNSEPAKPVRRRKRKATVIYRSREDYNKSTQIKASKDITLASLGLNLGEAYTVRQATITG